MHAIYGFLLNYDPTSAPDDLGDEAVSTFLNDYADSLCDENNWWAAQALVLDTGHVVSLVDEEDRRGRHGLHLHFTETPQEQRWEAARKWCLITAAVDMGVGEACRYAIEPDPGLDKIRNKAKTMSVDELVGYIRDEAQTITAKSLEEAACAIRAGCEPLDVRGAFSNLEAWYAIQDADTPPFSQAINDPYVNWRFYDLRDCSKDSIDNTGILFVDIHT